VAASADKHQSAANEAVVEDSEELEITAQEARRGIDIYGKALLPGVAGQSR
jgi:hypothetical protein